MPVKEYFSSSDSGWSESQVTENLIKPHSLRFFCGLGKKWFACLRTQWRWKDNNADPKSHGNQKSAEMKIQRANIIKRRKRFYFLAITDASAFLFFHALKTQSISITISGRAFHFHASSVALCVCNLDTIFFHLGRIVYNARKSP